jgi:hypothetical protein
MGKGWTTQSTKHPVEQRHFTAMKTYEQNPGGGGKLKEQRKPRPVVSLNFPPPPYHTQWFSSQLWPQAEWLAKQMPIRTKTTHAKVLMSKPSDKQKTRKTIHRKPAEYGVDNLE